MAATDSWSILNPDSERHWVAGDRGSRRTSPSLLTRLAAKVQRNGPDDCWPWSGARNARGYGTMAVDQRSQLVARVVFRLANGYWSNVTRHTCDYPPCCNPAHLIDGDKAANALDRDSRGRNGYSKRTHCPAEHEYTEENTVILKRGKSRPGQTYRACKTCLRLRRAA